MSIARCGRPAALLLLASAAYLAVAQEEHAEFAQPTDDLTAYTFEHAILQTAQNAAKKLPAGQKSLVVGEFTGSATACADSQTALCVIAGDRLLHIPSRPGGREGRVAR